MHSTTTSSSRGQQSNLANSVRWLQTPASSNTDLYSEMKELVPEYQERAKKLKKDHGSVELGKISLDMVLGGMRGMTALVWLGSAVDPDEGIRFRGMTIIDCRKTLPGAFPGGESLPESVLWLLLTGKIPSKEQVDSLSEELIRRATIPGYSRMEKSYHWIKLWIMVQTMLTC